jgi:hypothetical protein
MTMQSITPCQRRISDRFPVASFAVNVPPNRLFEIVCATDPQLLKPEYRGKRNAQNFFTSRSTGLLRAPAGQATYLVPPEQLKRFAGRPRLYFALASYGSQRGDDPRLSIGLSQIDQTPSIVLSADFTGRTLDRSKFRGAQTDGRYGAAKAVLTWGGDSVSAPAPTATPKAAEYDDGFSPELWRGREEDDGGEPRESLPWNDPSDPPDPEVLEHEEMGHSEAYGRRGPRRAAPATATTAMTVTPTASTTVEPPGFEDAVAARSGRTRFAGTRAQQRASYGAAHACTSCSAGSSDHRFASEPQGAEDARQLASYGGGRRLVPAAAYGRRYGAGEELQPAAALPVTPPPLPPSASLPPPVVATAPTASAAPRDRVSVDDDWREDDSEPDLPSVPSDGPGEALTIRHKFEIIMPVLLRESGDDRYSAVAGSIEYDDPSHPAYQRTHYGVHWGIASFNQRSGALGQVLRACAMRDSARFAQHFGASVVEQLLDVTKADTPDARLAPVGGSLLWSPHWLDLFRRAGDIGPFQAAQNEVAIERYVDRNLGFASALGLLTDRALAMVFDRTIQMGIAGARAWILGAVSPLTDDSKVQQAVQALGHADLAAFQQAAGLPASGRLGTQSHAALLGALRGLGERAPFRVPPVAEMLDRMVTAAAGRRFERRVRELRASSSFTDAMQRVI